MTVTRPARLTGAALCAALALIAAVWILQDLAALGSPADLAWYWAGDHHFLIRGRSTTSLIDPVLLAAYAATVVAALRSRHAASALAAAGTVTLALRLPGLWAPGSGALVTALLELALGAGLVLTAAVGRRPADGPYEPAAPLRRPVEVPYEERPTRPRTGPAVTAGILLALAALFTTLWELYWAGELPLEVTVDRFTGGRSVVKPALAPPPGWLSAIAAGLYGTAAVSCLVRARHSRAFGLLAAVLLTAGGLGGVARAVRYETLVHLGDLITLDAADVLTSVFELLAGVVVLVLLAGRGAPAAAPGPYPPAGVRPPAPPHPTPPGW
ncbi:hypothetical protein [Streptomyces vietnamensis]|uniref:Uncharacterized protein n=1 Tax=Streptomyces vietnamensis TaxID=362257 RepID=A0A0B5ING7_9ACTN|nr:hypothetical protein [Streptomyces vietnamensis]AJF69954.1 hypothetical protein SVTN_24780 [Streptomyces vietnamensis]